MFLSYQMGDENRAWVFWKSSKLSNPLSYLQPLLFLRQISCSPGWLLKIPDSLPSQVLDSVCVCVVLEIECTLGRHGYQ